MQDITSDIYEAVKLLITQGNLQKGQILVLGVSTSEVLGSKIGTFSNEEVAAAIWQGVHSATEEAGLFLAVQCCEHLNRALVIEEDCLKQFSLDEVAVVPAPKAGGAMAAHAFRNFVKPVVVENITAHYGVDIGQTLIGMHLKAVAVPYRTTYTKIRNANLTLAYSRPKLIGGERAMYCR